jgi:transglutaminase-like putative cysteine protease
MRKLVRMGKHDPAMRHLANTITINLPGKAWVREICAIFNYVRDNIRYSLDTNEIEVLQLGSVTLQLGYGDCDDFCILLATLLEVAGHPSRLVALSFNGPQSFSHVIVETSGAGDMAYIALDATEPDPMGWYPPGVTNRMVADI